MTDGGRVGSSVSVRALVQIAVIALIAGLTLAVSVTPAASRGLAPSRAAAPAAIAAANGTVLGPNVLVFDPSMPQSQIQSAVDAVATQQLTNQFGTQRYALMFKPGTYGTAADPLTFQVGYYTEVAGLGRNPGDVVVNGSIDVYNQCDATGFCIALNNFWRSLSNLTINVSGTTSPGCDAAEYWAVSQAAPMRRVHVNGRTTLMDYCTSPSFASGGFIADSRFDGATVVNGSQQQFVVRNTTLDGWSNGVWNQVFAGDVNAPAQCFPAQASCGGPYTTLAATPVSREKPYLYVDAHGGYRVFIPRPARNTVGETWSAGPTPGRSVPLSDFYIADPSDSVSRINRELARGRNLLLTPGVYSAARTIKVKRANTIVLGLGLATLTARDGATPMRVRDVPGVDIAGVIFDAGPQNSPVLLQVGRYHRSAGAHSDPANPTALQDVFFRVGGPHPGRATVSLQVNSDNVILDDIWAWRADHGAGVGWTRNTAGSGVIMNGDHVNAVGLFVEHFQKVQVRWNGNHGRVIFFQSEMPYDVPNQAAWMSSPTTLGYAAFKVAPSVTTFSGYGMGVYSFFNQGIDIYAAHAFEVPVGPGIHLHDLLTIFLDATNGRGGILNVVNDVGGPSTIANPDVPVTVVSYP